MQPGGAAGSQASHKCTGVGTRLDLASQAVCKVGNLASISKFSELFSKNRVDLVHTSRVKQNYSAYSTGV